MPSCPKEVVLNNKGLAQTSSPKSGMVIHVQMGMKYVAAYLMAAAPSVKVRAVPARRPQVQTGEKLQENEPEQRSQERL